MARLSTSSSGVTTDAPGTGAATRPRSRYRLSIVALLGPLFNTLGKVIGIYTMIEGPGWSLCP